MRAGSKAQAAALEAYLRGPAKPRAKPAGKRKAAPVAVKPTWGVLRCVSDWGLMVGGVDLPGMRTARGKNARAHWRDTYDRNQAERAAVRLACEGLLGALKGPRPAPPFVVTLIRRAPSAGLDDDNLVGALAYCRDGVADALGTGDAQKSPVTWKYEQTRGAWCVAVRIEWREAPKESGK